MNLESAIARFDCQLAADGRSGHTRAAYRRDLAALGRWLGTNPDVRRISPDDLARFLTSDAVLQTPDGLPRAPITINRTKSALRSFFRFCLESGWIRDNPARLIRSARTTAPEPRTLTQEEIDRLRTAIGDRRETPTRRGGLVRQGGLAERDRLIFELLLGTGIRLGSLVGLNAGDVNLKAGTLHIRTKGGGQDRVFLNPALVRMLGRFLGESPPEANTGPQASLFRSKSGKRLGARQVQLRFAAVCRKAGIDRRLSVHSLRHTFATRLYHKTGDLYLVQRALGHRQITTTEIYAKVGEEQLRRAVQIGR